MVAKWLQWILLVVLPPTQPNPNSLQSSSPQSYHLSQDADLPLSLEQAYWQKLTCGSWVLQEASRKHLPPQRQKQARLPLAPCTSPECYWQLPTYHARWNPPWDKANTMNGGADRHEEPGSLRMSLICWISSHPKPIPHFHVDCLLHDLVKHFTV